MLTLFHICHVAKVLHPALGSFLITQACMLAQALSITSYLEIKYDIEHIRNSNF